MSAPDKSVAGSTKPYLIRAIYDWALDQGLTPQVMVDVAVEQVVVPINQVKDGKIVLNLHPGAIHGLEISNQYLMFSARFAGRAENITIPIDAVMVVYARENAQGIVFQANDSGLAPPAQNPQKANQNSANSVDRDAKQVADTAFKPRPGAHLTVVK